MIFDLVAVMFLLAKVQENKISLCLHLDLLSIEFKMGTREQNSWNDGKLQD